MHCSRSSGSCKRGKNKIAGAPSRSCFFHWAWLLWGPTCNECRRLLPALDPPRLVRHVRNSDPPVFDPGTQTWHKSASKRAYPSWAGHGSIVPRENASVRLKISSFTLLPSATSSLNPMTETSICPCLRFTMARNEIWVTGCGCLKTLTEVSR